MIIYERVFASRSICYWHSFLSLYEGLLSKVRTISQKKLELKWVKQVRVALRIFKLSEKIFCHFGKWTNNRLITLRDTKQSRELQASSCLKLEVGHGWGRCFGKQRLLWEQNSVLWSRKKQLTRQLAVLKTIKYVFSDSWLQVLRTTCRSNQPLKSLKGRLIVSEAADCLNTCSGMQNVIYLSFRTLHLEPFI